MPGNPSTLEVLGLMACSFMPAPAVLLEQWVLQTVQAYSSRNNCQESLNLRVHKAWLREAHPKSPLGVWLLLLVLRTC